MIFRVKLQAVVETLIDMHILPADITILSENQAAIIALGSEIINSETVNRYRVCLNGLARRQGVRVV